MKFLANILGDGRYGTTDIHLNPTAWIQADPSAISAARGDCRALAMEPEAILFDEPTSALDPELVQEGVAGH